MRVLHVHDNRGIWNNVNCIAKAKNIHSVHWVNINMDMKMDFANKVILNNIVTRLNTEDQSKSNKKSKATSIPKPKPKPQTKSKLKT